MKKFYIDNVVASCNCARQCTKLTYKYTVTQSCIQHRALRCRHAVTVLRSDDLICAEHVWVEHYSWWVDARLRWSRGELKSSEPRSPPECWSVAVHYLMSLCSPSPKILAGILFIVELVLVPSRARLISLSGPIKFTPSGHPSMWHYSNILSLFQDIRFSHCVWFLLTTSTRTSDQTFMFMIL